MPVPYAGPPEHPTDRLVGQAPAIQTFRTQIRQLAAFDAVGRASVPTVLLSGETGTGKGLVARVLHDSGPRVHGPFIDVNCAAIPETMLEAELFGYEAGAFTDAKRAKVGLFEAASRGTLFLDEIDALPVLLQSKLLKVIEEKRLRRLGAVADQAVDVKLITATAADLRARVAAGQFRLDLYHRLAVVLLELPPLRARGEDIVGLARRFLQQYAAGHRVSLKRLSPTAEAWLVYQAWPGNVRELSHLMERVTLLHPEDVIEAAALAQFCLPHAPGENATGVARLPSLAEPLDEPTRIREALIRTGGNVVRAAQLLGLRRDALRYRMRRQDIRPPTLGDLSALPLSVPPSTCGPTAEVTPDGPGTLTPTARPEAALAWEPKLVAILALDLTWPEAVALERPAYDPWTVAARWEQALVAKVQGFGGVVLQHTPSLLLIAFGIPRTLEQQPQRAVHAALALRQGVVGDHARMGEGPAPALRLGLHWGPLLVAAPADERTPSVRAIGETLAIPVRLLGQAAPGEVLASGAMVRLLDGWCTLEPRRGRDDPGNGAGIGASVILAARSELSASVGRAPRRRCPFVGRAQQIATLRELWRGAQGGRGQVVALVGEPGVGKSRLLAEFLRGSFPSGARLLETRATAYTQTTPYGPIVHLLRRWMGITDGDDGPSVREQVTQQLARLDLPPEPTLSPLLSVCHGPLDDPTWSSLDPSMRRQRTLEAIQQVLRRESQVQPVLVMCEDAHWLDYETQAVLDRLVDGITEVPLLLLVTARPEYAPPWGQPAGSTFLRLDPLAPTDTAVLLDHWLGPDASLDALKHHLIARTGGNPFFLEESVQTLIETQAFVGEPGAYRLAQALPTFVVPATVQTVLAARIDRLPPETKHVLQTAAVIGHEVPLAWLQAVADLAAAGLRRSLAELQGAEFLYETRLFPDREYTFKHALTQQVAYETLLQERRRALHARLVETLEACAPERLAEQVDHLAYHAVRGEMWDKALVYGRQAGEHAMARSAYREAVGSFEQALRAFTHRPQTRDTREQAVDLMLLLRSALRPQGDFARILALLGEAEVHATALDDPRRLGQVSMWLSNYFSLVGAYDQAVAAAQRALTLADASGDVILHALANRYLGQAYEDQGDYRRAIDCLGETMVSLEGARRHQRYNQPYLPAVIACAHLAECHAELGRFAEGRAFGEEGLRIAEAMAHPTSLMYVIGEMGKLFLHQGDLPKAIPLLERAVHLCHEADLSAHVPWNISILGVALALSGRVDAAVPLLTQAMEQASGMDVVVLQARCRLALGQAQVLAGCLEEAQALAEQTLALARNHRQRGVQAYALCLLGEIAGRRDPVDAARAVTFYRQALVLAEDLGMRPLQAHCHRGLGTARLGMERRAEARTELTAAMALYRAMDMTLWLPEVDSSLVAVEGR